jgi:predicted ATPase
MRSHHSTISLAPLDRNQVRGMVVELCARHTLPEEVIENVAERTGGVPLFVEEVTRLLLERGTQGGIQAVPPTLQQSLTARLDRLGPAREVAQIGAVIGRDFSYPLLRAVAGIENSPLQTALDRLAEANILSVQGLPPNSDYRFTHSLIQDAAYENLLKGRRQLLHQRVAEVLHDLFPATVAAEPELLAHHFTRAGLTEAAVEWSGKAGQQSLERSALAEAIEQFTRGLALIATLPATPASRRKEIELQVALITPLIHVKGHAAPETKAAEERARLLIEHAEALGDAPEDRLLFSVLYGFWVANEVAFNGDVCLDLAAQFLTRAEKQGDPVPLMIGHRLMGSSLLFVGDVAKSQTHFDRTITLYNPAEHRLLAATFAHDVRVIAMCYRSWALWLLGYPNVAVADADQAILNAREIGQAATLMSALCFASLPHVFSGRYVAASALLDEVVTLADQKGSSVWKAFGMMNQGYVHALTGKTSDAIHMLTAGIAAWRSTGSTVFAPLFLSYLASSYADMGQFDEALRCVDEAKAAIDTTREKWWEAETNRLAGEIVLKSSTTDTTKAERHFEHALSIARKQQTKSLELRAAMSIARLRRKQGKQDEVRELLAPIYGWFTEGFDTLDLKEAKVLLEHLGWLLD